MTPPDDVELAAFRSLNRLAKWRTLLTGWQIGTRTDTDAEAAAIRDHREATLILRVESSALARLLIGKGVFTVREWRQAVGEAADQLNADLADRFPGVTAHEHGLTIDPALAREWMHRMHWKP